MKKILIIGGGVSGITTSIFAKKKNNEVINYPAYNLDKEVIDTNGAGDIFHGAFTYALSTYNDYYKRVLKISNAK